MATRKRPAPGLLMDEAISSHFGAIALVNCGSY